MVVVIPAWLFWIPVMLLGAFLALCVFSWLTIGTLLLIGKLIGGITSVIKEWRSPKLSHKGLTWWDDPRPQAHKPTSGVQKPRNRPH
jgi:hypothetical protein